MSLEVLIDRTEIHGKLKECIDMMHEIVTKRMSEIDHRIAAASALSDLVRTWEGMVRGSEKEERGRVERLSRALIQDISPIMATEELVVDDESPVVPRGFPVPRGTRP